jgi:hypothetical protein
MTLLPAAALLAASAHPPDAQPLEIAIQSVASIAADERTRGGGAGLALEMGLPLGSFTPPRLCLLLRSRVSVLAGVGLAYTLDLGVALSVRRHRSWQPDGGLYGMYLGGEIVRTVDRSGHLASNPLALQVGINPLRFELSRGWISLLGTRAGPTLGRAGRPPLAISITVFEVGQTF